MEFEQNITNSFQDTKGWAYLCPMFSDSLDPIKLVGDISFYGRGSHESVTEGFIFTAEHLKRHLEVISRNHFWIQRERSSGNEINLSPAVLHVTGANGLHLNFEKLSKGSCRILKDRDVIKLFLDFSLFIFMDRRNFETNGYPELLLDKYYFGSIIGSGGQSSVRAAYDKKASTKFAVKVLSRVKNDWESEYGFFKRIQHMNDEVRVMRTLNNPNVIKYVADFVHNKYLFIFMEYADCGSLLDLINEYPNNLIPESNAKFFLAQICKGLSKVHQLKIAHRDIKVENIFIKSLRVDSKIELLLKIGDFGFARPSDETLLTQLGTKFYLPPEIMDLNGEYTIKADIWSLGCLFFSCLAGSYPFHDEYGTFMREQIRTANINFSNTNLWGKIPLAKDLIKNIIQVDPESRPTVDEILNNIWFTGDCNLRCRLQQLYQLIVKDYIEMENFIKELPKIELHCHLNGSLSDETLCKLVELKQESNPDFEKPEIINYSKFRSLAECFEVFKIAHDLVDTIEAVKLATKCVIDEFSKENVIYFELRSTPRKTPNMTKLEYLHAIIDTIITCQQSHPKIGVKFIPSLGQHFLWCIDLNGDPTKGKFQDYQEIFQQARTEGFGITLHCGESETHDDEEVLNMLKFMMPGDRIGHGTFIDESNLEAWKILLMKQIPIEICLTSNVLCKTVPSYDDHHMGKFLKMNHPIVICTDDYGVFKTNLTNELRICSETFGLDKENLIDLSLNAVSYSFANKKEKQEMKEEIENFKKNKMF
ncbi:CLUMA_CG009405, isoform A [Clunio marinus]|uniref:CLUMA_CG009405, isoform A n=1 Tax=Clunio marinus TaxID=568069 RepID=A0A1J1I899_9DIPT|nr:CLUMA_CG009405, isoform A [Clunio marinus]